MDIYISYRDSAGEAEMEFRRLFRRLGHSDWFRLPSISMSTDGWSRMLPGLVCDLRRDDTRHKATPAIFMGMLGEQSMLSCALQASSSFLRKPKIGRLLQRGDYNLPPVGDYLHSSDRLDFLSKTVDGTVFIQDIAAPRRFPQVFNLSPTGVQSLGDPGGRHFRFPNLEQTQYNYDHDGHESLIDRLTGFLELLARAPAEAEDDAVFRRLVREYHCRFAWASVQLDETPGHISSSTTNAPLVFNADMSTADRDRESIGHLKTYWEKRGLLTKPFDISAYNSLIERRRHVSWPYWLQFLVLISNASRRANATFRKYSFANMRKFRRKGAVNTVGEPITSDTGPLATVAELFRGSTRHLPIVRRLRRRTRGHGAPERKRLSELRRALIVPGTDTVLSLYRGDPTPPVIGRSDDED